MTETIEAFDELYYFMRIFRDKDTTLSLTDDNGTLRADNYYGFADPIKPIIKARSILRFSPDVEDSLPAIQIVLEDELPMDDIGGTLGDDFTTRLSIYLITKKRDTVVYNDETYRIENIDAPFPIDNSDSTGSLDTLMLLKAYVFQRLDDFRTYADSYITWDILEWTTSEYIEGFAGVDDMVALRLQFDINFQKV